MSVYRSVLNKLDLQEINKCHCALADRWLQIFSSGISRRLNITLKFELYKLLIEQLLAYSNYHLHSGWCLSLGAATDTAMHVYEVSLKLTQTEQSTVLWSL